jgi:hypothetical protein
MGPLQPEHCATVHNLTGTSPGLGGDPLPYIVCSKKKKLGRNSPVSSKIPGSFIKYCMND